MSSGKCPITKLQSSSIKIFKQVFLALYFDLFIQLLIYICCCRTWERENSGVTELIYYSSSSVLGIEDESSEGGTESSSTWKD